MTLWKIAGAEDTPNGRRLYLKRPLCVLITMYCFDSSSSLICCYAWLMFNVEKYWPPESTVNKSSVREMGYCSNFDAVFTVSL